MAIHLANAGTEAFRPSRHAATHYVNTMRQHGLPIHLHTLLGELEHGEVRSRGVRTTYLAGVAASRRATATVSGVVGESACRYVLLTEMDGPGTCGQGTSHAGTTPAARYSTLTRVDSSATCSHVNALDGGWSAQ